MKISEFESETLVDNIYFKVVSTTHFYKKYISRNGEILREGKCCSIDITIKPSNNDSILQMYKQTVIRWIEAYKLSMLPETIVNIKAYVLNCDQTKNVTELIKFLGSKNIIVSGLNDPFF